MVNDHGPTGVFTLFREAVRIDFGSVPYEDIKNGLKYAIKNSKYMDFKRVCVGSGSYGVGLIIEKDLEIDLIFK